MSLFAVEHDGAGAGNEDDKDPGGIAFTSGRVQDVANKTRAARSVQCKMIGFGQQLDNETRQKHGDAVFEEFGRKETLLSRG